MTFTINGFSLQHALITAPYFGVWTAHVSVAGGDLLLVGDSATILLGDTAQWVGTITDGADDGGIIRATVIGGAAGLSNKIGARQWTGENAYSHIANAICAAAGETLADAPAINAVDFGYSNIAAGKVLDAISERTRYPWRVNTDGEVTFNATGVDPTGIVVSADLDGTRVYSVDDATAQPWPAQLIEHEYSNSELFTVIRQWRVDRKRELTGIYEGILAEQDSDKVIVDCGILGTFECSLWHGLQGTIVELAMDSPMLVVQLSAERFIALGHPDSSDVADSIALGAGTLKVARDTDPIIAGYMFADFPNLKMYWAPDIDGTPGVYVEIPLNPNSGQPAPPDTGDTTGLALVGAITDGRDEVLA